MQEEGKRSRALTRNIVIAGSILIILYFVIARYTGLLYGLETLNRIFMPIYLGVAMAFLMNPIMRFFEKRILKVWKKAENSKTIRHFVRIVCTVLSLVILLGFVAGFLRAVLPQLVTTVQYLIDNIYEKIVGVIDWADELTKYRFADVMERARTDGRIYVWIDTAVEWARKYLNLTSEDEIVATATRYGMSVGKLLVNFVIGIFIAIYLLICKEIYKGYTKRFVYGVFQTEFANTVTRIIRKGNEIFYGFIVGKIVDSIIIGFICYFSMLIMRMPYPILCSSIIGVTNIIPIFGPYIGALPTVILIFVTNPPQGIIFLFYIIILQQIDGNLIGPKILGDSTGVSSFWVIVAIVVGGGLFGFMGMLLGVPTLALLLYICEEVICYRMTRKGLPTDPEQYIALDHVVSGSHEMVMHSMESSYTKAMRKMRLRRGGREDTAVATKEETATTEDTAAAAKKETTHAEEAPAGKEEK
ncbi:MAG: AI-2E family transporter [Lachnospiraceae bacterium]|nr:AI-2E family transporter [Lachnospiraceae bacterium]